MNSGQFSVSPGIRVESMAGTKASRMWDSCLGKECADPRSDEEIEATACGNRTKLGNGAVGREMRVDADR